MPLGTRISALVRLLLLALAGAGAGALEYLHPYLVGRLLEDTGRPAAALAWLEQAPEWMASDADLEELAVASNDALYETELAIAGARVLYDRRDYRGAEARLAGELAARAQTWMEKRLDASPACVPVRLPRWRHPELLGDYDHLHVNLSPRAFRAPRVVAHEVAHFAWYGALAEFPALPASSPLWMEEGLADFAGSCAVSAAGHDPLGQKRVAGGRWVDLDGLDRQIHLEHDYFQATCLVEYLVRAYGWGRIRAFVGALRSGSTTWTALGRGFGVWPEDLLEDWHADFARLRAKPEAQLESVQPGLLSEEKSGSLSQRPPAAPHRDRRPPSMPLCLLVVTLAVVTLRRIPFGRALMGLGSLGPWPLLVLLTLGLVGDRLFWGLGLDLAAPGGEWMGFSLTWIWRHRLLWVCDGALLALATVALQRRLNQQAAPAARWQTVIRGWLVGAMAAVFVALLAAACGEGVWTAPREAEPWLAVAVLLVALRSWAEWSLFASRFQARLPVTRRLSLPVAALLYALWTHGPQASLTALVSRAGLLAVSVAMPGGAGLLAGWDTAAALVLCREAMAPAKLGFLRAARLDSWGAAGFDGWLPALVLLVATALVTQRVQSLRSRA